MACSPPNASVRGILQARGLEWLPFPSPRDLLKPGVKPGSPALQADSLLSEPPGKSLLFANFYAKHQTTFHCFNNLMKLPTKNWYFASTSTRIKSWSTATFDLQHPLKGVNGRVQQWAVCALGKAGRIGLQIGRYFQKILWAELLHLFISSKVPKSFMVMSAPHD